MKKDKEIIKRLQKTICNLKKELRHAEYRMKVLEDLAGDKPTFIGYDFARSHSGGHKNGAVKVIFR